MKKTSWYINRLSKMPPTEIFHRLRHKGREKYDELILGKKPLPIPFVCDFDLSALYKLYRYSHANRLYELKEKHTLGDIVKQANQYLRNEIPVFGHIYYLGEKINWHYEPKAQKLWPLNFWSKVNIRDGFTHGAPKFVWEVNRLYSLPILSLAYNVTHKEEYAEKILQIVVEWIDANPYPYGVNWTSGIELAVRVANTIWAISFLNGHELKEKDKDALNTFMFCHARHLFRFQSKYSSNNNHAIAEAFGLFLTGVVFPFYKNSTEWRQHGQKILERECLRQILPDGGSYEYSTTYLSFVFDFFLLFKWICDNKDISYNPKLDERLEKSCEYLCALMDSKGNIPNIGDQDSAVLINFGLDNQENLQSILNTGYVLFGREEFKRDNFPDIKTAMLMGDRVDSLTGTLQTPPPQAKLLTDSGLGVVRGLAKDKGVLFVGNATPLGMPPLYAHGHLDALSVYLSVDGKEILVDPGTYLYHSGGKWRRYFRSTAAHNTIRINGQDMTEQVGDFMFGTPYAITEHSMQQNGDKVSWKAGHNAYQNLPARVSHTRQADLSLSSGVLDIIDLLKGEQNFRIEQFFHFHPQCNVELDGNKAKVTCGGITIHFVFDAALQISVFKGSEDPLLGWFSAKFNHLEPCWTIRGQAECTGIKKLITNIIL